MNTQLLGAGNWTIQRAGIPTLVLGQLIVCNLFGNRGKTQHRELHCLGYLGTVGSWRIAGKELFSYGV